MPSIIEKMKDKLHIGKDKDDVGTATYNKAHGAESGTTAPGSTTPGSTATGSAPGTTAGSGTTGSAPVGSTGGTNTAVGYGTTGTTHGSIAPGAHGAGGAHSGITSQKAGAQTSTGTASGTSTAPTGSGHGVGSGAKGAAETVTIHERDPNWGKARELTTGAEHASKVSAAKAYEAESYLVSAQDAHKAAQEHVNLHADLAAQAEAEKRNIGTVDSLHKEVDHVKNVIEEKESIHREFNKGLEGRRDLVAAKEGELNNVIPLAVGHQKDVESIQNKLGSLQGAKSDLERKQELRANQLAQLKQEVTQAERELHGLETEVEQLNSRAAQLEAQAKEARELASSKAAYLRDYKTRAKELFTEADKTQKGLAIVEKDLEGYRAKEAQLLGNLEQLRGQAQQSADIAAAKQAELQLAKQQYDAERQKGLPMEQDIERYHKSVQEKEHELVEAQETSKSARAAYEKFSAEASQHAAEIEKLEVLKDEKLAGYKQRKAESDAANSRAASLWAEAKKYGNTGDANALQRLAEAEKEFKEVHQDVSLPLVTPDVGVKQPTTEGPKIHRSEKAGEKNDETNRENVQTREYEA